MQTDVYRLWPSRIVTFAMAALAAASAAYWGLKTLGPSAPAAATALSATWASPVSPKALALALGGGLAAQAETTPAAASRYALVGVVAARSHGGAALISIDGQEAKPVRVGALVDGGLVLESVTGRRAVLSSGRDSGADKVTLELPPLNN
jgi:general secretion pathway protein C